MRTTTPKFGSETVTDIGDMGDYEEAEYNDDLDDNDDLDNEDSKHTRVTVSLPVTTTQKTTVEVNLLFSFALLTTKTIKFICIW